MCRSNCRGGCRGFFSNGTAAGPVYGGSERLQNDPHFADQILFYEYFHGDNGAASEPATRPAGLAL